jgi:hypothetical protein
MGGFLSSVWTPKKTSLIRRVSQSLHSGRTSWSPLHPWIVSKVGVYGRAAVINGFRAQAVVARLAALDLA